MQRHFEHYTIQGVGIGLRNQHFSTIIESRPETPWFEILSDNYMHSQGLPLHHVEKVRADYPITLHGVGMSLASTDPLNMAYLKKLKSLVRRIEPTWISDHLAWVSLHGHYLHDLLPFPYTRESLRHVAERIIVVQDYLGRQILVENPSSYLKFNCDEMTEWEFIAQLVDITDCHLLLDVNNIYVSAQNNGFDPQLYLNALPREKVREIHLAGYEDKGDYLFDTHGHPIHAPVWSLYQEALTCLGNIPTLIEWDNDIPEFSALMNEAAKAQHYMESNPCPS